MISERLGLLMFYFQILKIPHVKIPMIIVCNGDLILKVQITIEILNFWIYVGPTTWINHTLSENKTISEPYETSCPTFKLTCKELSKKNSQPALHHFKLNKLANTSKQKFVIRIALHWAIKIKRQYRIR